jgi:hypothetical protein
MGLYKVYYAMLVKNRVYHGCNMVRKYVVDGMAEVMYPGHAMESKLCHTRILAWRFVEGAEY